jgi:ATP-dependent Clp protease ATP-binding subunit ClpA
LEGCSGGNAGGVKIDDRRGRSRACGSLPSQPRPPYPLPRTPFPALPVHARTSHFVYKYLDLADRFIRVRVAGPSDLGIEALASLDRAGYRRAVIAACVEGYAEELVERLRALSPDDPAGAEELLYQLAVSVNPELEIRNVALRGVSARERIERATRAAPSSDAAARRRILKQRAPGLAERLGARVFGQGDAIRSAVEAVRRAAAGLAPERGPLATMLFVGPTGTGKTELARALAAELGEADGLLRIDCGELGLGHETSRLIGAPPGYVGFEAGGFLTEGMRKVPRAVVVFDEVEKAHPKLFDLMLSVLEEGELVDGKGRVVSFREALVIMTSNAGARDVDAARQRVGFAGAELAAGARAELAERALSSIFPPEFLSRVEDVVHFRAIDLGVARSIAGRVLGELALRVRAAGHRLVWTQAVADWVARSGFDSRAGARGIAGVVRRAVEGPLADLLLGVPEGEGAEPAWVRLSIQGGRPRLRLERGAP